MYLMSGEEPKYPTAEEIPDHLIYDPSTGFFRDRYTGDLYRYVDGVFYKIPM